MAGLMQPNPGQAPAGMGQAAPEGLGEGEEMASPEEQAQYDAFVKNGMKLLYSEKATDSVLGAIEGAGDPVEGIANALAMVMMRLEDSAGEAGQEIGGDVKLNAAGEIFEQLVELAEAAGIHEYSDEDMETALLRAMDIYRETRQGQGAISPEPYQEDLGMLMQAEQSGQLDAVAPGLKEYAAKKAGGTAKG